MEAQSQGPYIQAALFADMILEDKTGSLSAIRIIDRITHTAQGPNAPEDLPPFSRQLNALIAVKPGRAMGRQNFTLWMVNPDATRKQLTQGTFHFAGGPNQGANLAMNLNVTFEQEGVYYFDFEVEGHLLTRMPIEVIYQRIVTGPMPGQAPGQ